LLKLVTPPLIPVPLLPEKVAESRSIGGDNLFGEPPIDTSEKTNRVPENVGESSTMETAPRPPVPSVPARHGFLWTTAWIGLLGLSASVTMFVWFVALLELRRVKRLVGRVESQSGREVEVLEQVARRFGLHSAPRLLIVNASITPMLLAEPFNTTIVLPRKLADSLDDGQLRNVISHEIAHYVRRDHWANLFAFFVTSLFWWNPVAWLARRAMTAAAEASCDAIAMERLEGSRKSYAETLLVVVDFVMENSPLRPTLSVSFGESRSIKRSFEMIANTKVKSRLSRVGWILLVFTAVGLLLIPTRGQEQPFPSSPSSIKDLPVYEQPDDPGRRYKPAKANPPALRLSGFWTMNVRWRDASSYNQEENGTASFSFNHKREWNTGLLATHGEQPPRKIRFRLTSHGNQLWIDMIEKGGSEQLGICKLSEDNSFAQFAFIVNPDGTQAKRPKDFDLDNTKHLAVASLKRIEATEKNQPDASDRRPATLHAPKENRAQQRSAVPLPQSALEALGPHIPSGKPERAFVRAANPLIDNPLRGRWTASVDPAGPDWFKAGEMFMFFGGGYGLLSDVGGTSPIQFWFLLGEKDGQRLIDLTFPGEPAETQYGIYEMSKNKASICFCTEKYHSANGRPKSFKEANPEVYTKLILTRDNASPTHSQLQPDRFRSLRGFDFRGMPQAQANAKPFSEHPLDRPFEPSFEEERLVATLYQLARAAGLGTVNIVDDVDEPDQTVTLKMDTAMPIREILNSILTPRRLTYEIDGETLRVSTSRDTAP